VKTVTVSIIGPFSKAEIKRVAALVAQFVAEHPRKSFMLTKMDEEDLDRMLAERHGQRPPGETVQ
jgi:hypothetical protein